MDEDETADRGEEADKHDRRRRNADGEVAAITNEMKSKAVKIEVHARKWILPWQA